MSISNKKQEFLKISAWLAAVLLHWTWGLPQTLLGFLVFLTVRIIDRTSFSFFYKTGTRLTRTTLLGAGLSLGFLYSHSTTNNIWENPGRKYRHGSMRTNGVIRYNH